MNRAILWDMDGTLLDSEPAHEAAFDSAIAELGLDVPHGMHDGLLGASGDMVFVALQAATGLTMSFEEWTQIKHGHFVQHAQSIVSREPAASFALELGKRGVSMGLVTNSTPQEVELCLSASGLASVLSCTVTRADVAQGKPSPQGYLLGAERLRVRPELCLVVEDSAKGVEAGLAAGMSVIYHPQTSVTHVAEGAVYVPPEADIRQSIETFLKTGLIQ